MAVLGFISPSLASPCPVRGRRTRRRKIAGGKSGRKSWHHSLSLSLSLSLSWPPTPLWFCGREIGGWPWIALGEIIPRPPAGLRLPQYSRRPKDGRGYRYIYARREITVVSAFCEFILKRDKIKRKSANPRVCP